jgi:hypothetical protein
MLSLVVTVAPASQSGANILLPPHALDILDMATRPVSLYVPVENHKATLHQTAGTTLYLNRFGGAYTCGDDDATRNISSIACGVNSGVAEMSGFKGTDDDWNEIVTCVQDLFAPFNLHVTDQEPLEGTYIEGLIGGSPEEAGMSGFVGGVSPYTCDFIEGAVTYIFADIYGNANRDICETAGQELAHAFGLDHELLCADPMTYLTGCGEKEFRDEYAPCGEYEPRECACGEPTQNSVQWMLEMFGAADGTTYEPPTDTEAPTVSFLTPAVDGIMPANTELVVAVEASDDVGLTVVELEWDFSGEKMFCPSDGAAFTCTRNGTAYTWKISVGQGLRNFRVHVRDSAGREATTEDRSLWFSTDGNGPPEDSVAPSIVLGMPLANASLLADVPLEIVATVFDDSGLARVELDWQRRSSMTSYPCPYEDERLTCTVDGSTYRWSFARSREGSRKYLIRAVDVVGNTVETAPVEFTVDAGGIAPVMDGNDALDEAATLACGAQLELDGNDSDWFVVDAKSGDAVDVNVEGAGNWIVATDGKRTLAQGATHVNVTMGEKLLVGVTPGSAINGAYSIRAECKSPKSDESAPAPESCAAGAVPSIVALAFALRRRRR